MKTADDIAAVLDRVVATARETIQKVSSAAELEAAAKALTGKKSELKAVNESIKDVPGPDRPKVGQLLGEARSTIEGLVEARRESFGDQDEATGPKLDLSLPPRQPGAGSYHLVERTQRELVDIFLGLGYNVAEGPEAEDDWHNFEALNFPPGHPARDTQDTMYLERGNGKEVVLRTQTSTVQIRTMRKQDPPVYVVSPGRVFRRETLDARHSPVFHQIEGLAVDRGITMADMFGTITKFVQTYFGKPVKTRFLPHFFPFTEPSAELFCTCVFCDGSGCRVCSKTGWIELGGCGVVDPNVLNAVGYDPEEVTGFAFGFGLERMVMMRHNIDNIGDLYLNDIRFLRQF